MRGDLQRRQPQGVKPAFDPEVFRARFLLLQRGDHLDDVDRARLDTLFAKHPGLDLAWRALHELHGLYPAEDRTAALEALDRLTDPYATGELIEFHHIVDTIIANLLQVLRRVAHGFTNPHNSAARGLLLT